MNKNMKVGRVLLLIWLLLIISACDQLFTNSTFHAGGKLTPAELDYFLAGMKEATKISEQVYTCIKTEAALRAEAAGDPETLDPKSLSLPEDNWLPLEKKDKRIILAQLVVSEASVFCTTGQEM
jgi:hypothetical protein